MTNEHAGGGELAATVAMVTGAARGIGRASAVALARRGADVVVCDIVEEADETVGLIKDLGREALYVQTDISDRDAVRRAVDTALSRFGRLDFAHNNAGIGPGAPLIDMDEDTWLRTVDVNLTGTFLCMKYQLPHIRTARGAIVNTASMWGLVGFAGMCAYSATKHGIIGLTKTAALECGPSGVRVNAIAPGPIDTPLTAAVPAEFMQPIVEGTAVKRYGTPGEVGEVVAWLCSPQASYVTGAIIPVDGGSLAS